MFPLNKTTWYWTTPLTTQNVNVLVVRMSVILIILLTSLRLPKPGVIKRVAHIQEGYSQDGTVGTLG